MTIEEQVKDLQKKVETMEKQTKEMREIYDNIFGGSNQTRLYLKRKIAFDAQSLIGFFGKEPIKLEAAIADVSGGATIDANARTALNALLASLRKYGLLP